MQRLPFVFFLVTLTLGTSLCAKGGGGSRSSGGYRSSPRPSSGSGRQTPNAPTRPSTPSQTHYGWSAPHQVQTQPSPQKPKTDTGHTASSPYGWKISNPQNWQFPPHSTSAPPPYGWANPKNENVQHPTSSPVTYGWKQPTQKPPPYSPSGNTGPPPPYSPSHHTQNSGGSRPPSYSPNPPHNSQPPPYTPQYNSGKKFERGYTTGYDKGFERGVQHATRINPAYNPPQNNFGYPGQGLSGGHGSPSYNGMSIFGTPNNYGYNVNSAYGYQTYGTGNHDFRNGILLGTVGGYLLNSALHPSHHGSLYPSTSLGTSNPWGYSGGGYGSGYQYTKYEHNTVNNNNYFNDAPKKVGEDVPENWVQCIAYDPMTETTFTNPNCTCTVTVDTNSTSNVSFAHHNCITVWGTQTEVTPVKDVEILDSSIVNNQVINPEKLKQLEIEKKRMEIYKKLETLLNMGSFTS